MENKIERKGIDGGENEAIYNGFAFIVYTYKK